MGLISLIARLSGRSREQPRIDRIGRAMQGVNPYWRRFSQREIAAGEHRPWVGGDWDAIGPLQLEFLKKEGLLPRHKLVETGRCELAAEGLSGKDPTFLANDRFDLSRFGVRFDFGIAVSLFTHIYLNHILRCLAEVRKAMNPGCRFYASIFEAPFPAHLQPITHPEGGHVTHCDANPFHYAFDELKALSRLAGLEAEWIGDWGHPRGQKMVCFEARDGSAS